VLIKVLAGPLLQEIGPVEGRGSLLSKHIDHPPWSARVKMHLQVTRIDHPLDTVDGHGRLMGPAWAAGAAQQH